MRRSGKLSVRARLCAHGCAYGPLYGMWLRMCVRRCAHARACVYACVYWCRLGSWDQRALLGPSSEDTLRSTPARLLHALPLLLVKLLPLDPCPLPSAPLRAFTPLVSVRTGVALWQGGAVALHVAALFSEARIHPR